MPITWERTAEYLAQLSQHGDPLLERLEAEARRDKFPIIGPAAGKFLYLMARTLGARRICELGSGFGYSTLWFCQAVRENGGGEVHHTVWEAALQERARANLAEAGYSDLVQFHLGEAVGILRELPGSFDLIFCDIEKDGYPAALPVMKAKLRVGGMLLIDNMLWGGRLWKPDDLTADTQGVRDFTRALLADPDFIFQLIPIRDGVIAALKVSG